jgi:galactokinase
MAGAQPFSRFESRERKQMNDRLSGRLATVESAFRDTFARRPSFTVQAPGRVNLIGEHTDYNDGFVLPVAIDRNVLISGDRRLDRKVVIRSLDFAQTTTFDLDEIEPDPAAPWSNYIRGVAGELRQLGLELSGLDAIVTGDVPIGSGLSSSAAIEVASAYAFLHASQVQLDPVEIARLCQRAENRFVGVNCGIMDQFISTLGRTEHALLIDCRDLSYRAIPFGGPPVRILVADTGVRRGLVDSEYNARRSECEEAVRIIRQAHPEVRALRDVSLPVLDRHHSDLPEVVFRRARHVVSENERVTKAASALFAGDLEVFGQLMVASHASLRDDYEVSCSELDAMVDAALGLGGVIGSRMTGAGFGGCTVSLVEAHAVDRIASELASAYQARTGRPAIVYACFAESGAGPLTSDG